MTMERADVTMVGHFYATPSFLLMDPASWEKAWIQTTLTVGPMSSAFGIAPPSKKSQNSHSDTRSLQLDL